MRVFKFGGASVKNTDAIRNVKKIVLSEGHKQLVIVVSAMDKTTARLENMAYKVIENKDFHEELQFIKQFHFQIADELFLNPETVKEKLLLQFAEMENVLQNKSLYLFPAFLDRILSFGEILSSILVYHHLAEEIQEIKWIDARQIIKTDNNYGDAGILWSSTQLAVSLHIAPFFTTHVMITQGYIGSNEMGETMTLGKEGSDFTAAILAHCIDAKSMTVWKDVAGMMNADPKKWIGAKPFQELSYRDLAEMTYYGASVIHPKTVKPLSQKNIPLHIRSFIHPELSGTLIHGSANQTQETLVIHKSKQMLITIKRNDLSFVTEKIIHVLFGHLDTIRMHVHLFQHSATTLSIVTNEDTYKVELLIKNLSAEYSIRYNTQLQLITVKNPTEGLYSEIIGNQKPLISQQTRSGFQVLLSEAMH